MTIFHVMLIPMAGRFFHMVFLLAVLYLSLALELPTTSFSAESMERIPLAAPSLSSPLTSYPGSNVSPYSQSYTGSYPLSYKEEEDQIPKGPTSPPPLTQKVPIDVPHCERHFVFKGKRIECDSEMGKDALRLSFLMRDLPYAQSELDIYRKNRQEIRIAGFIGTVGVLAMISGVIISHPILDPASGSIRPGGFIALAGMGIMANSVIYGLSMMKANEVHIDNAVQYYNTVHPGQPIALEFSTHIDF